MHNQGFPIYVIWTYLGGICDWSFLLDKDVKDFIKNVLVYVLL